MHKATIRYAVSLNDTWKLSKEDIINLRTGICSKQFQNKLLTEDKITQFHGCKLRNVYVKCDTNEVVFIIEPDWTSKSISLISVIEPNNDFFEKYLYENIISELIESGRISNNNLEVASPFIDTTDLHPDEVLSTILPVPTPDLRLGNETMVVYCCPRCKKVIKYAIKRKHGINHCPECNNPITIGGTKLVSIKEDDMNDGN